MPTTQPSDIGRFEKVRALGEGGTGTVFEARDRATGATVAIKALRDHHPSALFHFKREFRVLSELAHPNVVRFGELLEANGRFYLTMELIEGANFLQHVRRRQDASPTRPSRVSDIAPTRKESPPASQRRPRIAAQTNRTVVDAEPPTDALVTQRLRTALRQLCSGVMAIHSAGLVHRDIKPQNVLVALDGRVVLLDFGLAIADDEVQKREFVGTLAYMAPEQISGGKVTQATDWYAVGVVLYESLTGRLPHTGSALEIVRSKTCTAPPAPDALAPGVPKDLSELCMSLLALDPAERPSGNAVLESLGFNPETERARASFRSKLHFSRAVFVAREAELASLRSALTRAYHEGCEVVRIVGESGVGKSALVRQLVRQLKASSDEAVVFAGRCYERETVPYRGVDLVIDSLAQYLAEISQDGTDLPTIANATILTNVFPALQALPLPPTSSADIREDPQEARRLAFAALRDLLRHISSQRPVLIHIDDAQWIDAESVTLLSFLVERESVPSLLLLFSERPQLADPLARVMAVAQRTTTLDLAPLPAEDSRELAEQLLLEQDPDSTGAADTIAAQAGGHPLFIHELVLRGPASATAEVSLEGALTARVQALENRAARLLDIVALASSPLPHEVLQPAADLTPDDYAWVLFSLRSENFVSFHSLSAGDEVQTYHDRIRELVVQRMTPEYRADAHRTLASCIERHVPDDYDALAHHYLEGGVHARAVHNATRAAERALKHLAFERAASLFELATRAEADRDQRSLLEERRGQALANAGLGTDAANAYLEAAVLRSNESVQLQVHAGEQLLRAGHLERGTELLYGILRDLGLSVPSGDWQSAWSLLRNLLRLRLRGLAIRQPKASQLSDDDRLRLETCWTLATGISLVHHLRATDFQARTLILALEAGAEEQVLKSASILSSALAASSGFPRRIAGRLNDLANELVSRIPTPENQAWLDLNTGVVAMGDWDFRACERLCTKAESAFRNSCTGVAWEVATSQAFALWSMAFQGKLKTAAERTVDLMSSARARGDRYALMTLTLSPLHLIGLANDEPDHVRATCESVMRQWPDNLACFQHMCAEYVLAQVSLYEGNASSAWDHVRQAWTMLQRSHLSRVQFQRIDLLGLRARAAMAKAISSPEHSRPWLKRACADRDRLLKEGIDASAAMAALIDGNIQHALGADSKARACFFSAHQRFDRLGMEMHSQLARLAHGTLTADEDTQEEARRELVALGIKAPQRMLRLWIPALEGRPPLTLAAPTQTT